MFSKPAAVAGAFIAAALVLGACGSSSNSSQSASTTADTTMVANAASTTPMNESKTIVDIAAANPDFSTLVAAVKAAGLASTLSGPGPFTVFAPTNAAFQKLPAGTLSSLLQPQNKQTLAGILTYHVLPEKVMAADVKPGKVMTVNGEDLTISTTGGKVTITDAKGNTATVVKTDIVGSNGVIHVIDSVLQP
jgi:uncharacterized surface protein with fasciclin (FAS1) repeats